MVRGSEHGVGSVSNCEGEGSAVGDEGEGTYECYAEEGDL